MPSFSASDIPDLVKGTLYHLGRFKFQQIAQDLVRYEVFTKWFKEKKAVVSGGLGIQRNLMTRYSQTARHVSWNDEDNTSVSDFLEQMRVDWRSLTDSYGFDYREVITNTGEPQVVDIIKVRRAACMLGIAAELERAAWTCPAAADTKNPYGIPYWVVMSATTGFNGGLPSDHTTIANVNLTTQAPNFKNYTWTYSAVNKTSCVKNWRTAHRLTQFVSPVKIDDYRGAVGEQFRHYANETTLSSLEDVGEAQNENLGRDLGSMDGTMTFRSNPIIYIPQLDEVTTNPIYSIDHSTFYPIVQKGMFMVEGDAVQVPGKHLRFYIPIDLSYNYVCVDRRRNSVGYYVAP